MFSKKNNPLVSNVIQIIIWFSQRAMKVAILKKAALIPSVQTDVGLSVSYLYRHRGGGGRGGGEGEGGRETGGGEGGGEAHVKESKDKE